jgi:hypothetical protein
MQYSAQEPNWKSIYFQNAHSKQRSKNQMLKSKTTQSQKARWYQYHKTQSKNERDNLNSTNTHFYIGKIKRCPKCHLKGYLKLSGSNFQVQHQIQKITIRKGIQKAIYRYCTLPTLREIIKEYDVYLLRKENHRPHNKTNADKKKREYDKKRYTTEGIRNPIYYQTARYKKRN